MARYVVLSFEDNAEAEDFVAAQGCYVSMKPGSLKRVFPEVIGLFAQPTQFCENSGSGGCSKSKRVRGWSRGKKYGWWVCSVCHKPSNFSGRLNVARNVIGTGVNLFPRIIHQATNLINPDDTPASVHDEGWGAYREGIIHRG